MRRGKGKKKEEEEEEEGRGETPSALQWRGCKSAL
jgi:hypothetical protein